MDYSEGRYVSISQGELMQDAKRALEGKWGVGVITYFVFAAISMAAGIIPMASLIIAGPFALGLAIFGQRFARNQEGELSNIFDGFKNFGNALAAYMVMILVVLLGAICLIIPGIIAMFGLSQTFFILADRPNTGPVEALKESWEMMKGHKMDYFILMLRFLPWAILCIFTFGIGFLWLGPWYQVTMAMFYDEISGGFDGEEIEDDITRHIIDDNQ